MITPILVVSTICATGAAVLFAFKAKAVDEKFTDIDNAYDALMDKYTNVFLEANLLRSELAKYKRKPRKDKGQTRKMYGGKPITRKRKIQKGE